jgi:hypothetical protein
MENPVMSMKKKRQTPLHSTSNRGVVDAYIASSPGDTAQTSLPDAVHETPQPLSTSDHLRSSDSPLNKSSRTRGVKARRTIRKPVITSAIVFDASELAFSIKLRNLVQYTFECFNDIVYNLADITKVLPHLQKGLLEMKSLNLQSHVYLDEETERYFVEFIGETEASIQEEAAPPLEGEEPNIRCFRHYVRVSWLSQCILKNLDKFGKSLAEEAHTGQSA